MPRQRKRSGPRNISDAQIAEALRKNGGIQAAAARVLKVSRAAICMRVAKSPELQTAMNEGMAALIDVAQDNVVRAIRERDMISTRWFLERKGVRLGYSNRPEAVPVAPPDPAAQAEHSRALTLAMAMLEERARQGLPPLFYKPEKQQVVGVTPKQITNEPLNGAAKPNGHRQRWGDD